MVDSAGEPCAAGTTGDVLVRGEQVSGEYQHGASVDDAGWFAAQGVPQMVDGKLGPPFGERT